MVSASQLLENARSVIERLTHAGIRVHPSSRLHSYLRAIEAALPYEYSRPPDDVLRICHRALAELHDFDQIIEAFQSTSLRDGWSDRITEALGGGVLRSDEGRHIRARDTQFELAVAATLCRNGCTARFDEPDIIASTEDVTFAVAVKRPRSRRNLDNVLRDAGNQLLRSQFNGILAVDTTAIVNPDDGHLVTADRHGDEHLISTQAIELAKYMMATIVRRFGDARLYGILSRVAIPLWDPRRRQPGLHYQWTPLFVSPEQTRERTVVHRVFNRT